MHIALRNVRHRYATRQHWALNGVNLSVASGQAVGLMGPSGSGKSTLLSVASGLLRPTEGDVELCSEDGTLLSSGASLRENVAWIFQANYMLPRRTAFANVALACQARGLSRRSAAVVAEAELHRVGLEGRTKALVEQLSGGEVQRVAIARAFAQDRPVVLADEPTGQLDRRNTQGVADALVAASRAGRVVIVATHDPLLAERLDRVVRLVDGEVTLTVSGNEQT